MYLAICAHLQSFQINNLIERYISYHSREREREV
jgi:hypothetical protein